MPPFIVCIHDVTPAYSRETRAIIDDLAPLIGRRFSCGVVPDWNGEWALPAHPRYCRLIQDNAEELLLHGYFHRRERGAGPATFLTGGSDEMNGLDPDETHRTLERGQRAFADVFGERARGFLPPAWQTGRLRARDYGTAGLDYVMGFFSIRAASGRKVALATSTWDCGRWGWLGHIGHGLGSITRFLALGVPVLAIHPRDLHRGYRPMILRATRDLLDRGFEPSTVSGLLERNVA